MPSYIMATTLNRALVETVDHFYYTNEMNLVGCMGAIVGVHGDVWWSGCMRDGVWGCMGFVDA